MTRPLARPGFGWVKDRVLAEDLLFEFLQRPAGLETQLVSEGLPVDAAALKRLGLPS